MAWFVFPEAEVAQSLRKFKREINKMCSNSCLALELLAFFIREIPASTGESDACSKEKASDGVLFIRNKAKSRWIIKLLRERRR